MEMSLIETLRRQLCESAALSCDDRGVCVDLPLYYDDGDGCRLYVERRGGDLVVTDRGDVFFRCEFGRDESRRTQRRHEIMKICRFFGIEMEEAGLIVRAADDRLAESLFQFAQAALEIVRASFGPKHRTAADRAELLRAIDRAIEKISPKSVEKKWSDPKYDPDRVYAVDYRVVTDKRCWHLFTVVSDQRSLRAAISCLHYASLLREFPAMAVLRDRAALSRTALRPLEDAKAILLDAASLGDQLSDEIQARLAA